MNSFNSFLQDKHAEIYEGINDKMEDSFEIWLSGLDPEEWIRYAEEWFGKIKKSLQDEIDQNYKEQGLRQLN